MSAKEYTQNNKIKYSNISPLTPSKMLNSDKLSEVDGDYLEMLDSALKYDDVLNIALTGVYGSGKSSILEKFKKKNNDYQYFSISLASLTANETEERFIEERILKHIMYQESSDKLPFSRFNRISKITDFFVFLNTILVILLTILGVCIFNNQLLEGYVNHIMLGINEKQWSLNFTSNLILRVLPNIVFLLIFTYIISKSIFWILRKISITKVVLKNIGMSLEPTNDKSQSIYNKYLDEIYYFFEVTKYNIIIFEDIDRFNKSEIFTNIVNKGFSKKSKVLHIKSAIGGIPANKELTKPPKLKTIKIGTLIIFANTEYKLMLLK